MADYKTTYMKGQALSNPSLANNPKYQVAQYNSTLRELNPDNKHKLYLFSGIIFALILVFSGVILATTRTSWRGKAASPGSAAVISLQNSYVFASPISAFADGVSIIRVTVFILNNQGLGVSSQNVTLKTGVSLNISKVQEITDDFGRAIFDVTSSTPGNYTLNASVSGSVLPQSVSVSFQ